MNMEGLFLYVLYFNQLLTNRTIFSSVGNIAFTVVGRAKETKVQQFFYEVLTISMCVVFVGVRRNWKI